MRETTKRRSLGLCALAALLLLLATPMSADLTVDVAGGVEDTEAAAMIGGFGGDIFGDDCLIGFMGLGLGLLAGAAIAASGGTALVVVAIAGAYAPAIGIAIC